MNTKREWGEIIALKQEENAKWESYLSKFLIQKRKRHIEDVGANSPQEDEDEKKTIQPMQFEQGGERE